MGITTVYLATYVKSRQLALMSVAFLRLNHTERRKS